MSDICVCAEEMQERTKYPCGHALCLTCTLKKRILMHDDHCPYCRSHADYAYVVKSADTDQSAATIDFEPGKLKVENDALAKSLRHILSHACPVCDVENKNYKALKAHVLAEHGKTLCDVCTSHEFIFSDEYTLLQPNKVKEHLRSKHIYCRYCNNYHYSSTEFLAHCREKHMGCTICERINPDAPLYFRVYEDLRKHYTSKHYMCMVPECLENLHIVFQTEVELQNHMQDAHREHIVTKRHPRSVDISRLHMDTHRENRSSGSSNKKEPKPKKNEHSENMLKYNTRLELIANHDPEIIEKIKAANTTFITKNVPVEIFISTHEAILKGKPEEEINALMLAFLRAYSDEIPLQSAESLNKVIETRIKKAEILLRTATAPALPSAKPVQPAAPTNFYSAALLARSSRPSRNIRELPTLQSVKKTPTYVSPPSRPLASLPSRRPISVPSTSTHASVPGGSAWGAPRAPPRNVTNLPALPHHSVPSTSGPSVNNNKKKTKVNLNELPSLPQHTAASHDDDDKKKKHRVIRMV